jgi:hypothetical protein
MSEVENTTSESVESTQTHEEQTNTEGAEKTEEQKEEQKAQEKLLRKFKLKVDGEEFEEEIDLNDTEKLARELQLARAAKKRMAEAQMSKRQAYELAQMLEKDPAALLRKMGDKGYDYAEQLLLEKIQREMMTPEQREYQELKARLEKYERAEKEAMEKAEAEKQRVLEERYAQEFQQTIIGALEKSGLPRTPETAKRMAYLLQKNMDLGLDLSAEELAEEARKEAQGYVSALSKESDAEKLIRLLGPEVVKKLRKYDLDQLKKKQFDNQAPSKRLTQSSARPQGKQKSYATWDEWQEDVNKRLRNQE